MLFRRLFDPMKRGPQPQPRRPAPARLSVEALDDRIVPAPLSPTLSVGSAAVVEGNAGTTTAAVVVTLANSRGHQTVTVHYATQDGTAVAGGDYVAASGTLTFAPGETSKTVLVPVAGDRLPEPDEYFVVNLSGARNAKITGGQGVVGIIDDEPRVSISHSNQLEGNSGTTPFTFTVTLAAPYDQAVTVNYATQDGTAAAGEDYVAAAGTLTFAPGETTKTIAVGVVGDATPEPDEYFFVNLGGASANSLLSSPVAYGTVVDDDGYYGSYGYYDYYYGSYDGLGYGYYYYFG